MNAAELTWAFKVRHPEPELDVAAVAHRCAARTTGKFCSFEYALPCRAPAWQWTES